MAATRQTAAEKREEAAKEEATEARATKKEAAAEKASADEPAGDAPAEEESDSTKAAHEDAVEQEEKEEEIKKDPNQMRVGSNVIHTSEDRLGIKRIVGYSNTTWEPASAEPSEDELARADELVEAGIVPAPEKGGESDESDK